MIEQEYLNCPACGAQHALDKRRWRCDCGSWLEFDFFKPLNPDKISSRPPNLWRYREALPITEGTDIVTLDEGFTPITPITIDGLQVMVKQENRCPTGSFKDRGAAVMINKVRELGIREVVEDSSGNAGAAVAAYCAAAGIACHIYVPAATSAAKLIQIEAYGARVHRILGSRAKAAEAAVSAAADRFYASHTWNPFFLHGTKTFAFEVCEQLGWHPPDTVILPVGNGSLLLGSHIGFNELFRAGIIHKIPKLIAVQAAKCNPIHRAFNQNLSQVQSIQPQKTAAEGIAIPDPVRGNQIVSAVRATGGEILAVEENEILEALSFALKIGHYIEPTSAVAIAGIRRYRDRLEGNPTVVTAFTGHGLKSGDKLAHLLSSGGVF